MSVKIEIVSGTKAMAFIMKKARQRGNFAGMPEPEEVEKWLIEFSESENKELKEALKHTLEILYNRDVPKELYETYHNALMNYNGLVNS